MREEGITANTGGAFYYNINIVNNNPYSVKASTNENFTTPLCTNGTEYDVSCVRFVMDGTTIPLFLFEKDAYYVAMSWTDTSNGHPYSVSEPVLYYPQWQFPSNAVNSVYTYTSFCNMINAALYDCYNALNTAIAMGGSTPPSSWPSTPPVLRFIPSGALCVFLVPIGWDYAVYGADAPALYFNNILFNFFGNFNALYLGENNASKQDYLLLLTDENQLNSNIGVPSNSFLFSQEYSSVYLWFDLSAIVFVSNTLGVIGEFTPITNNTTDLISTAAAGGGPATTPMFTDFAPYFSPGDAAGPRGYIYFTPSSEWRRIPLIKDIINQLDVTIMIRTQTGAQYPYYLPPHHSFNAKLAFTKRE